MVRMPSRASSLARSSPTPQSEVMGLRNTDVASSPRAGAESGEAMFWAGGTEAQYKRGFQISITVISGRQLKRTSYP